MQKTTVVFGPSTAVRILVRKDGVLRAVPTLFCFRYLPLIHETLSIYKRFYLTGLEPMMLGDGLHEFLYETLPARAKDGARSHRELLHGQFWCHMPNDGEVHPRGLLTTVGARAECGRRSALCQPSPS